VLSYVLGRDDPDVRIFLDVVKEPVDERTWVIRMKPSEESLALAVKGNECDK
jgi:hypothetical protein